MNGPDLINNVLRCAHHTSQRTGQYLFNSLPEPITCVISGTLFDPFHEDMDAFQLTEWVQNHLVFGKSPFAKEGIIAVFDGNMLLWEAPTPDFKEMARGNR